MERAIYQGDKISLWNCDNDMGITLHCGDCLEIMKSIPDKSNIQSNLTSISLLAIILRNGGYYGKR